MTIYVSVHLSFYFCLLILAFLSVLFFNFFFFNFYLAALGLSCSMRDL